MRDTSMRTTLRIGVLDNDSLSVEYMKALLGRLNRRDDVSLDVWGSSDVATAIHRCCFDAHRTDVLFLDMALSGMDGVGVCRSIREMGSRCAVVGMTSYHMDTYRKPLRDAGGQALLDKKRLVEELPEVLAAAAGGAGYPVDGDFPTVEQSLAKWLGGDLPAGQAAERIGEARHRHDAGRRARLPHSPRARYRRKHGLLLSPQYQGQNGQADMVRCAGRVPFAASVLSVGRCGALLLRP